MQLFEEFVLAYLEFLADEVFRAVHAVAQHITDGEELRLVVLDHATVRRDVDFAVGKGIEGVDGLVGRDAWCQMHLNLYVCCRQVFHLTGFDLAFLDGFHNRVLQRFRGLRERNLADDERLLVYLLDLRTHLEHASALSVIVFRHIDTARSGEIGEELEGLLVEVGDGRIADLTEVMRQDLRRESDSDTLSTLCQQQRELHGQGDGLLVATVV